MRLITLAVTLVVLGNVVWQFALNPNNEDARDSPPFESREPLGQAETAESFSPSASTESSIIRTRSEAEVDRLIDEGYIPEKHRDLWLATAPGDANAELTLRNLFEVIPERRVGECEYPEDGPQVCWNYFNYHPYLAYDPWTLRQMAQADDPVAAAALSVVIPYDSKSSFEERFYYATRAAELTGKGGDILRFMSMAIVHPSFQSEGQHMEAYVFARHAESFDTAWRTTVALERGMASSRRISPEELRTRADNIIAELYRNGESRAALVRYDTYVLSGGGE